MKRAITDRGWNPLNRALLKHPDVLKTRSIGEGTNGTSTNDDVVTVPTILNWETGNWIKYCLYCYLATQA